jgi:hypothetical protein
VKKEEKTRKIAAGSKRARGFKKSETCAPSSRAVRDHHARVPLGISTALFPIPRRFDPIRSLLKACFALYKGHFVRDHPWKSLGWSDDRRFRPDGREPTRNPKIGPRTQKRIEPKSSSQEAFDAT